MEEFNRERGASPEMPGSEAYSRIITVFFLSGFGSWLPADVGSGRAWWPVQIAACITIALFYLRVAGATVTTPDGALCPKAFSATT